MIINDVKNIIESYLNENDCYDTIRESEDGYIDIEDELTTYFTTHNLQYKIEKVEGFDSPGYSEDFMAIAFSDENNDLQLLTVLFECY